ncbi:MAG: alpha/beta fold hydrolase [Alphaproteobacteria bacterium]|nr:alpha/beta fold hydrolase [Alphaproteobacteria bacterium]
MNTSSNPELGRSVVAAGIATNYHDHGTGAPVILIHGSGPGVTAWANWRLVLPILARDRRVLAPDMVGFGYTERPAAMRYDLDLWVRHAIGFLDALGLDRVSLVGNSFGGGLALALALRHPARVKRLVLMGSCGIEFPITPGLEAVWGYTPSPEAMRALVSLFAYDQKIVTDDLVRLRYEASIRPGFHEAYAAMFPAPRQRHVAALASPEHAIKALERDVLIVHGREDRIIPVEASIRLHQLIRSADLHVFGRCGHWTQIEHTARFCRLVADFLGERP